MAKAKKILIVDDDADWRALLRMSLEELGYEVKEADGAGQALRHLNDEEYSVMLLDVYMPGMSGEDLYGVLPEHAPQVVFVTSAPAHELNRTLAKGPYYLPKGAGRHELALLLQSLAA